MNNLKTLIIILLFATNININSQDHMLCVGRYWTEDEANLQMKKFLMLWDDIDSWETSVKEVAGKGEAAIPYGGGEAALSAMISTDQSVSPLSSSSALSRPVAPRAKTRPRAIVGVARGPGPPSRSSCLAVSLWTQISLPVVRS